ncbi:SET domain-containing protein [candidate division KSB1 bacterium]|nr:SET domain-containing protein [candidate division KSB1 bacterium]
MIHPHTELRFINNDIGYGVVATRFIPKGTITWVLDKLDREFSPLEMEMTEPIYREILNKYCFRNNKGNYILCWDNARYVNHSFNSNCLTTAYDFELAIRDIHPGEELTDDYGYLNIEEPFRALNEGTRRKIVYPNDLLKYHKIWDKKLLGVICYVNKVAQPLRELIDDNLWDKITSIADGREMMDSILSCYYTDQLGIDLHGSNGGCQHSHLL